MASERINLSVLNARDLAEGALRGVGYDDDEPRIIEMAIRVNHAEFEEHVGAGNDLTHRHCATQSRVGTGLGTNWKVPPAAGQATYIGCHALA